MSVYRLYGWSVAADFPLHLPETDDSANLRYRLARIEHQSNEVPSGETLLDYTDRGRRWYAASRRGDGTILFRIFGQADVTLSARRDEVEIALLADTDVGMASVFAAGSVPSLLLDLSGNPVLHASSVTSSDGTTAAFLGRSGQGKSTLAALMCLEGGILLSDDVLPVVGHDPVTVAPGTPDVRLRDKARDLARQSGRAARVSADARHVLTFREFDRVVSPRVLDAIFVPLPNRGTDLEIRRLSKPEAHLTVMRYPRLLGWRDRRVLRAHFELASAIAASVPVFLARVPWGPPFRRDIVPLLWQSARDPDCAQ